MIGLFLPQRTPAHGNRVPRHRRTDANAAVLFIPPFRLACRPCVAD
jgi:hypothetical protein